MAFDLDLAKRRIKFDEEIFNYSQVPLRLYKEAITEIERLRDALIQERSNYLQEVHPTLYDPETIELSSEQQLKEEDLL